MLEAMNVLGDDPRFKWLIDKSRAHENAWRPTILAELGRIPDQEIMRAAAEEICKHKLSTRQAIAYVRKVRGVRKQPDSGMLLRRLFAAYNGFVAEYPEISRLDIEFAVRLFSLAVAERLSEHEKSPAPRRRYHTNGGRGG